MKEFFKKVKILYDNKKYRSLVILCAYFIFFTIVILIMQNNARHQPLTDVINKITLENMQSYSYKYTLTSNDENYTIEGVRYNAQERLVYNGQIFYIINDNLYVIKEEQLTLIDDDIVSLRLLQLNSTNLNNIINVANKDYTIDGDIVMEKYTISFNRFLELYDDTNIVVDDNQNVFITISKKDNIIMSIELDLPGYKLLIEYSNINKINNLDIPYELPNNIEE